MELLEVQDDVAEMAGMSFIDANAGEKESLM